MKFGSGRHFLFGKLPYVCHNHIQVQQIVVELNNPYLNTVRMVHFSFSNPTFHPVLQHWLFFAFSSEVSRKNASIFFMEAQTRGYLSSKWLNRGFHKMCLFLSTTIELPKGKSDTHSSNISPAVVACILFRHTSFRCPVFILCDWWKSCFSLWSPSTDSHMDPPGRQTILTLPLFAFSQSITHTRCVYASWA